MGSPQSVIHVYKDGKEVAATAAYDGSVWLGGTDNDLGLFLVDDSEYGNINRVKLGDGTIVKITP